jgi:hypothetical protein
MSESSAKKFLKTYASSDNIIKNILGRDQEALN